MTTVSASFRKCYFSRCRELREYVGLSMSRLAASANVSRDLVRSLERGNAHSRHKVLLVFKVLNELNEHSLNLEDELHPFEQQ